MNKIILITGSTSGIGKAAVKVLARMNYNLILIAKDEYKVRKLINELIDITGNKNIEYFICDLSSMQDIKRVAEDIKAKHDHLDVLINNAGLIINERKTTIDGFEYTFALDHLSYFLLTGLLIDLLKAGNSPRIINTSSAAHMGGHMDFCDLMQDKRYSAIKAYCQAKLANVLFTYELARKLNGSGITVNCLHPGTVNTNFGNDIKGFMGKVFKLFKPFLISPDKGAETLVYLATSDEVSTTTSKYFYKKKPKQSSSATYKLEIANLLWNVSEKLTKFKYNF